MNHKNIILSERSHTYTKISTLLDSTYLRCPEKANLLRQITDRGCLGLGIESGLSANRLKGIFCSDENGVKLSCGDGCQLYKFIKII